jgi:hypothetical protein
MSARSYNPTAFIIPDIAKLLCHVKAVDETRFETYQHGSRTQKHISTAEELRISHKSTISEEKRTLDERSARPVTFPGPHEEPRKRK